MSLKPSLRSCKTVRSHRSPYWARLILFLVWQIWILNKAEREAGGIYCFDRAESLQQFLASQLAADVRDHPAVSEFSGKSFEVMDAVTALTRGPVEEALAM